MRLRKLEKKDAPFMLEWMHDESVVENLQANFKEKNLSDCERFIEIAQNDSNNVHMAIVNDSDIYMGTVSLKNITDSCAEFAITVRSCAMGQGYSKFAMTEIINIAFEEMSLKYVYWYVSKKNTRAIKFYDKNGYKRIYNKEFAYITENTDINKGNYFWYIASKI